MQRDISPEEKLLSIIKGNHDKVPAEKGTGKPDAKDMGIKPVSPSGKIDDYVSIILKSSFFKNNIFDPGILKVFNRCMAIILVIAVLYFIGDIFFVRASGKANSIIAGFSSSVMPAQLAPKTAKIEARNYSYYSNKVAGKKIFGAGTYVAAEFQSGAQSAGEQSESNIGLVGIIPGARAQAIIEDRKAQKTYYLMKGQSVNDISVEDIDRDKVTIEYKGKRMSLFL
ncbi:MAG: type II secretion system protein N [Candidatus Omnitrophota bacterium]|nr:type II secretion system protein N [Candidatus Omnitrophota bacterium]